MNYTPEQIQKINRLIATKIEGFQEIPNPWYPRSQPNVFRAPWAKQHPRTGDGLGLPNYHESLPDLERAVEAIFNGPGQEDREWSLNIYNSGAYVTSDMPYFETQEFTGPGRITKALYSALAEYVLGMEGGGE